MLRAHPLRLILAVVLWWCIDMFTPQDSINTARYITNDLETNASLQRQTDAELLTYFNDGLKEMSVLMPAMFFTIGDLTCVQGQVEQSITFNDAQRLIEVLCIHEGTALTEFDRMTMDQFMPGWRTQDQGAASQYARLEAEPLVFYLDKPAPAGQVVDVRYQRIPAQYAIDEVVTDVPATMSPALADYIVYRAEMKDDENVLTQRAMASYAAFKTKIGVVENG